MSPTIRHKYKYFHSTAQKAEDRGQKFHFSVASCLIERLRMTLRQKAKITSNFFYSFLVILTQKMPPTIHCKYKYFHFTVQTAKV